MRGPRPTRRGIAVAVAGAALLAAGLMIDIPVLRGLGGFALGALAVALVPSAVRLRPGATRTLHPVRLERGQRATARLVLSNDRGQRQPAFTALDRLDGEIVRIAVPALPRGGRSEHAYVVPTTRRGLLQVGPLTVERTDPLGLARFRTDLGELATLWVYPRRIPVRVAASGRLRHHHEGMVTDRPLRGTADLRSLREYIPGDELRHVHARASARTGTLVVRELVDPVQPHCTIVLDNRPSALSPEAFEEAVEVAASIAWSAVADGCRVVLRTAEGDSWRAAERPETMQPLLDRLASIGQVADADLSRTLSLTGRHGQGGWLVVVTGAADRDVLASLTGMRGFSPITIFDVSGWPESATAPGVAILRGGTATDVITQWNRTVAP